MSNADDLQRLKRDHALRERARAVIPGGMYGHQSVAALPASFPQFIARAEGCRIWDADGNEYIDYMSAYGPNLLGYRHPVVEEAAAAQRARGDCTTGPAPVMVELAERFVELVDHADWVLLAKNGTDATTICVTIARAATGRRTVLKARGAYHGAAPWCTPIKAGVLREERASFARYEYNDVASLEAAFDAHEGDVAAVLVTPFRHDVYRDQELVDPAFARRMRELCDRAGAALILDDVRAGLRMAYGSSWEPIGVRPDLSAWSKAIANGHALAAVAGGDALREAAGQIFTTGSFWFSAVAMAAAVATIGEARRCGVIEHSVAMGERLRAGLEQQARSHGLSLRQTGPAQMPMMLFDDDEERIRIDRFAAECVRRGAYLHPFHNMFLCGAHTEADIDRTLEITEDAFAALD
jgi:glutamate-1-semialdehyde 2,1-aminomutase